MKLYTFPQAPSPRRVHLFLAEKELDLDQEIVDLAAKEQLGEAFARINPQCTVPALVLDDGTCLWETMAICRYLESLKPEPVLLGHDPVSQAVIENWNRWVEFNGWLAVLEAFRNSAPRLADHALPGRRPVAQIPELAERGRVRYRGFLEDLDARLGESEFVAGPTFSVADITALVAVDFAARAIKEAMPESAAHLRRWHAEVSSRPSVASEAGG